MARSGGLHSVRLRVLRSLDLGTLYFRATAATGIPSSRSCLIATTCSPVRRRGRPSSTPFALAASRPALVRW